MSLMQKVSIKPQPQLLSLYYNVSGMATNIGNHMDRSLSLCYCFDFHCVSFKAKANQCVFSLR